MAEPSNGRQHHRPSRLKDMQPASDSDTSSPEARPKAAEHGIEDDDDIDIDQEDLAIMAKCSIQKPTGSATAASQASTLPPHNLFVRPDSATVEQFNPFAKRATINVSTAVTAIAPAASDALGQGMKIVADCVHILTVSKIPPPARYRGLGCHLPNLKALLPMHRQRYSRLQKHMIRTN